jgi:hypothetical protein
MPWGTAADLTIDAILDARGGKAQQGLLQIFWHFNDDGFYWGAAFPNETMHFEASDELIRRSQTEGEVARDARDLPRAAYYSGLADVYACSAARPTRRRRSTSRPLASGAVPADPPIPASATQPPRSRTFTRRRWDKERPLVPARPCRDGCAGRGRIPHIPS